MRTAGKDRKALWILSALILLPALSAAGQAQNEQQNGKSPWKLKLSSSSMRVCLGSSLPLELEVTNQSNDDIRIDKLNLWQDFSFQRSGSTGERGWLTIDYIHGPNDSVLVKADASYRSTYDFSLQDNFFGFPEKYIIKLHYEQVYSNEVSFEIYDCNPR